MCVCVLVYVRLCVRVCCVYFLYSESTVNQRPLVLQHEKYSSQLQMNLKVVEVKKEAEDRPRTPSSKTLPQGEHSTRSPSCCVRWHACAALGGFDRLWIC